MLLHPFLRERDYVLKTTALLHVKLAVFVRIPTVTSVTQPFSSTAIAVKLKSPKNIRH